MKKNILNSRILLVLVLLAFTSCSEKFQQYTSTILARTGLVSGSQASSLMKAGGKIVSAVGPMSEEQEYYVGRGVSALILAKYPLYRDAALSEYLTSVARAISAYSDRPETFGGYHVAVIDTNEVNTLSAPGGFIFVSKGLIKQLKDEEQLAGVIAHEVAHVVKGHGVNAISQSRLTDAFLILGKEAAASYGPAELQSLTTAFDASINEVFETLIESGYSRSQEYDADALAAELMIATGYSAQGLDTMLAQLEKMTDEKGWFNTHPAASKRRSELEDILATDSKAEGGRAVRAARFSKATVKIRS